MVQEEKKHFGTAGDGWSELRGWFSLEKEDGEPVLGCAGRFQGFEEHSGQPMRMRKTKTEVQIHVRYDVMVQVHQVPPSSETSFDFTFALLSSSVARSMMCYIWVC